MDAAREIIHRAGPKALTMRAVAQRVGVTHAAPYRHFANKAALVTAAGREELALLARLLRDRRRAGLHAMGQSYLLHGQQHEALYCSAFSQQPCGNGHRQQGFDAIVNELVVALREHLKTPVEPGELDRSALHLWAGWHGATMLAITAAVPMDGRSSSVTSNANPIEASQLIATHCACVSDRLRRGSYAREDGPAQRDG